MSPVSVRQGSGLILHLSAFIRQDWEADHELASASDPVTVGGHGAAVQMDQAADQRQAQTKAAVAARQAAVALDEAVEDVREQLGRDPDAAVADMDRNLAA